MLINYSDRATREAVEHLMNRRSGLFTIDLRGKSTDDVFRASKNLSKRVCEVLASQGFAVYFGYRDSSNVPARAIPVYDFITEDRRTGLNECDRVRMIELERVYDYDYRDLSAFGSINLSVIMAIPANTSIRGGGRFNTETGEFFTVCGCRVCGEELLCERDIAAGFHKHCAAEANATIFEYHARPHKSNPVFTNEEGREKWLHAGVEDEVGGKGGELHRQEFASEVSRVMNGDSMTPFIEFENDSSTEDGIECITAPSTHSEYIRRYAQFEAFYSAAKKYGGEFYKCNGLHVHLDRKYYEGRAWEAQIYIECMVYKYMSIWRRVSGRCSEGEYYYSRRKSGVSSLLTAAANTSDQDHFYAVNASGSNTIELRFFGGMIDAAPDFFAAIDIAFAIGEWAKKAAFADGKRDNFTPAAIVPYLRDPANVSRYIRELPAKMEAIYEDAPQVAENEQPAFDAFVKAINRAAAAKAKAKKGE